MITNIFLTQKWSGGYTILAYLLTVLPLSVGKELEAGGAWQWCRWLLTSGLVEITVCASSLVLPIVISLWLARFPVRHLSRRATAVESYLINSGEDLI